MSDRQFRGIWIPVHIWETSDLTAAERCLWAEIDSFTNAKSGYYKTNQQASEELGVSQRQVSRAFAKLESMGLITVEKQGIRRVAKSTPWRGTLDTVASNPRHH
jgi:DNA-binding transcriptional ArsR family regulator